MRVSVYFAVFIAVVLVLDSTGLAALAMLCALLHECGHIFVLWVNHIPVEKLSFRLFGIDMVLKSGYVLSYSQEEILALAGCAVNFITCVPAFLLYNYNVFPRQTGAVFIFSFMLGCFNLLPVGSLDGGRALEAALCRKMSCDRADKICITISAVFIVPVAAAGIYILKLSGYNISLIAAAVYLAVMLLIKSGIIKR